MCDKEKYNNDVLVLEIDEKDGVVASYYGKMYDGPMMGKLNEKGRFDFSSISDTFEDYKNSMENLPARESVGKVLAKYIDDLI